MSNRELEIESQVNTLQGVNERMEALLLENNLVSFSKNIHFGLEGVATRIEGKKLAGILSDGVLNIQQFGDKVLIQTLATLQIAGVDELTGFSFIFAVSAQNPPTLVSSEINKLIIKVPTLGTNATGMRLLMSTDNVLYTSVAEEIIAGSNITVSGLSSNTTYHFKVEAFNSIGSLRSPTLSVSTLMDDAVLLTYVSDGDTNGVFHYLGTDRGTSSWANPDCVRGIVREVTPNIWNLSQCYVGNGFTVDRSSNILGSDSSKTWIGWDLGAGSTLVVNRYSIRNRNSVSGAYPRSWKIQGSNNVTANTEAGFNSATWTDIDSQVNNTSMNNSEQWLTIAVSSSTPYRFLRFLVSLGTTGAFVTISEAEFYGTYKYTPVVKSTVVRLVHSTDGDTNGLFYYLGTNKGTAAWANPQTVRGTLTILDAKNETPAGVLCDRAPNGISLLNDNNWVMFVLPQDTYLRPTKYSIRARTATGNYPRNWKLQGFCENPAAFGTVATYIWLDLDTQVNNTTLNSSEQWLTLSINVPHGFRFFRFLITGGGSSGAQAHAIAEFELYGDYRHDITV